MSDLPPPPYVPHPPGTPSAPGFPSAYSSQPSGFPGSPYQTVPQNCGADHPYYQGPPGLMGPPGPYLSQPGYPGYQSGPPGASHPWDSAKMYGDAPKQSVFMVDQNRGGSGVGSGIGSLSSGHSGGVGSCLGACSAALCCCCLWDMLTRSFC
ncbi:uncharacterized protein ABDE67_010645 [Symphorus nematophorus]